MKKFPCAGLVSFHLKSLSNLIHLKCHFIFLNREFSKTCHPFRNIILMASTPDRADKALYTVYIYSICHIQIYIQYICKYTILVKLFWWDYFWVCCTIKFTRTGCMCSLCVEFSFVDILEGKQKLYIIRVLNNMLYMLMYIHVIQLMFRAVRDFVIDFLKIT